MKQRFAAPPIFMLTEPFQNALVLTGPTGSGKSRLALTLAPSLNAEIVAMDSMTLYRGMDIGTAKPTLAERKAVPHHLIDVLDLWESASVAWWLAEANRLAADIEARGKQVLFVGGTPLYLKALIAGLFDGPPADDAIRDRLKREADDEGHGSLHQRLSAIDPACAARIHPNDIRRTIRALEVWELTGKRMSDWQTQWSAERSKQEAFPAILCLDMPRAILVERIERRVDAMFAEGLLDEARRLLELDRPLSAEASKALGYAEAFDVLAERKTLGDAVASVKARTRNLAKRQMTWFRHLPGCQFTSLELTLTHWRNRMK